MGVSEMTICNSKSCRSSQLWAKVGYYRSCQLYWILRKSLIRSKPKPPSIHECWIYIHTSLFWLLLTASAAQQNRIYILILSSDVLLTLVEFDSSSDFLHGINTWTKRDFTFSTGCHFLLSSSPLRLIWWTLKKNQDIAQV